MFFVVPPSSPSSRSPPTRLPPTALPLVCACMLLVMTMMSVTPPLSSTTPCQGEEKGLMVQLGRMMRIPSTPIVVAEGLRFGYMHSKASLLSGTLNACDPSPNSPTCVGGIASVSAYARSAVSSGNVSFVVLIPEIDLASSFVSMHPQDKGVNLDVFGRIHDQHLLNNTHVLLDNYVSEASLIASTKRNLKTLLDCAVTPLATTIMPPATSPWRHLTTSASYIDISTGERVPLTDAHLEVTFRRGNGEVSPAPLAAFLHVDDMSRVWTASTVLSPAAAGVGGQPSGYAASATETSAATVVGEAIRVARRVAGLIIVTSDDVATTPEALLSQMLAYELMYGATIDLDDSDTTTTNLLPDVYLLQAGVVCRPFETVAVNASFTLANGTVLFASREVHIGAMIKGSCGLVVFDVNEGNISTTIAAHRSSSSSSSAGLQYLVNSVVVSTFNPDVIPDSVKDALFYEDQSFLLNLSRIAAVNDPYVGSTLVTMPPVFQDSSNNTCYTGECGQSSLLVQALQWKYEYDVAIMDSGGVRGPGWAAGSIHMSDIFALFPFLNHPCTGTLLGLRIYNLFTYALSVSALRSGFPGTQASDLLQASGVRIEYAAELGTNTSGVKIVSFEVYNQSTSRFEPLQRLHYYSFVSNDFLCSIHTTYSMMFSEDNAYRGESKIVHTSADTVRSIAAEYLTSNNPHTPILTNYYVSVPSSDIASGTKKYLLFPTGAASCTSTQLYDEAIDSCIDCPTGMSRSDDVDISLAVCVVTTEAPSPIIADNTVNTLVLALAIGAGVLLLAGMVVLGLVCECRRRSGSRDNVNVPHAGSDVAIVFTDIECSTKLWGAVPLSMGVALDAHHHIMREVISKYGGYEVKTVGDSFMVANENVQRAVEMAAAIQHVLYSHKWPASINCAYNHHHRQQNNNITKDKDEKTAVVEDEISDDPDAIQGPRKRKEEMEMDVDADDLASWNGLRVRIGIHYGPVEMVLDEVTKGFDFYGPTVNIAARVEGTADGGQVRVSSAVAAAVPHEHSTYHIEPIGPTELRGVADSVHLYAVVPKGLEGRSFVGRVPRQSPGSPPAVVTSSDTSDTTLVPPGGTSNNNNRFAEQGRRISIVPHMNIAATTASNNANNTADTIIVRQFQTTIRGALTALRGEDRVAVMERLRRAWRIQLPSGRPFKGQSQSTLLFTSSSKRSGSNATIGATSIAANQSRVASAEEFRRSSINLMGISSTQQHLSSLIGSSVSHRVTNNNNTSTTSPPVLSPRVVLSPIPSPAASYSLLHHPPYHPPACPSEGIVLAEENNNNSNNKKSDEDIIFGIIAQRLASKYDNASSDANYSYNTNHNNNNSGHTQHRHYYNHHGDGGGGGPKSQSGNSYSEGDDLLSGTPNAFIIPPRVMGLHSPDSSSSQTPWTPKNTSAFGVGVVGGGTGVGGPDVNSRGSTYASTTGSNNRQDPEEHQVPDEGVIMGVLQLPNNPSFQEQQQ